MAREPLPVAIAVDAGTSGARAVAVDLLGRVVAQARRPYPTMVPRPGWAEQDPRAWGEGALEALGAVAARLGGRREVVAIGLTGQCPTVAPYDGRLRPVGPGLMYRDNRATAEAVEMRRRVGEARMHRLTGHVAEAFHVGPKVLWLRRHDPAVFAATAVFLQPRDVVLHALTGVVATDETHANATLFFELEGRRWSEDLLGLFDVDASLFPAVLPSRRVAGRLPAGLARRLGLPRLRVVVGAADSQCAAYGCGAVVPGPVSEMAGASTCINAAVEAPLSNPAITHYSHVVPGMYCTELGVNTAGAALEWGRQSLGYADHPALEAAAAAFHRRFRAAARRGAEAEMAPLFLPYLADGERTDPRLRAAFVGLAGRHDRGALAFAVIEGVSLAVAQRVDLLRRAGSPVDELRTSGGGARHRLLAQVKADVLDAPVMRLAHDATATGCALLAASACGYEAEAELAIARIVRGGDRVQPDPVIGETERNRLAWFEELIQSPALHAPEAPR